MAIMGQLFPEGIIHKSERAPLSYEAALCKALDFEEKPFPF